MKAKFDKLYKDAIGATNNPNDPILVFIDNLKDQINMNEDLQHPALVQRNNRKQLNSNDSFNSHGSLLYNEDDDEDEDEDYDEDDSNSLSAFSDDLFERTVQKSAMINKSGDKLKVVQVPKSKDQSKPKKFKKS